MLDVITIGTATRDVFLLSPFFKVFKDPEHLERIGFPKGEAQCFAMGAKLDIEKVIFSTGGGAVNAAVGFSRAGLETAALAVIGADARGKDILDTLKKEKIKALIAVETEAKTTYSTILLSGSGERTILVYRNPKENLESRHFPLGKLKAKWAYIVPGAMSLDALTILTNHLTKHGIKIAINPSSHFIKMGLLKVEPILNKMKVVSLNREEAAELTGISYDDPRGIFKKFDSIIGGLAVMTDGPNGVLVSDGNQIYKAGIFKEKSIVDRTGAGDAFGSGFVATLAHSFDIKEAIRYASANATSVVERVGAHAGALTKKKFESDERWKSLVIDTEPL
jgi:sugar/nucleoside kinase (ribokinase family)